MTAARRASPLRALPVSARAALAVAALAGAVAIAAPAAPEAAPPPPPAVRGECTPDGRRCLYRSMLPSAGIVADCRSDTDCRVGYYYGDPANATWFAAPPGMTALPRPMVIWRTATLAETRVDCGRACTWSYFFEARRRRVSPPRRSVLEVDTTRLLLATAEEPALVIRQLFSGREVARIQRDWAPGGVSEAVTALRFAADGRLTLTWLQGPSRAPVTERVSVPSIPRADPSLGAFVRIAVRAGRAGRGLSLDAGAGNRLSADARAQKTFVERGGIPRSMRPGRAPAPPTRPALAFRNAV